MSSLAALTEIYNMLNRLTALNQYDDEIVAFEEQLKKLLIVILKSDDDFNKGKMLSFNYINKNKKHLNTIINVNYG